jgi:hypothetical protein
MEYMLINKDRNSAYLHKYLFYLKGDGNLKVRIFPN